MSGLARPPYEEAEVAVLVFGGQELVARPPCPAGDIGFRRGVVSQELEHVPDGDVSYLLIDPYDGFRAEEAGHVQARCHPLRFHVHSPGHLVTARVLANPEARCARRRLIGLASPVTDYRLTYWDALSARRFRARHENFMGRMHGPPRPRMRADSPVSRGRGAASWEDRSLAVPRVAER